MNLRLLLFVVVTLLAGLGGGYVWYWFSLANGLSDGFEVWLDQRRAQGYVAQKGDLALSGFPLAVRFEVSHVFVGQGDIAFRDGFGAKAWQWRGHDLAVEINPFAPQQARLFARGRQSFSYIDRAGILQTIKGFASRAEGLIGVGPTGVLESAEMDIERLELSGLLTRPVAMRNLKIALRQGAQLNLSGQINQLLLPPGSNSALGDLVEVARLDASLSGPLPLTWTKASVAAWRDGGGLVNVTRARLKWGSLNLLGTARIALDEVFRPKGAGRAQVSGQAKTIAAFRRRGLITPLNAAALTIALSVLGRDAEGNVSLPITAKKGRLRIGPVTVARLRPLKLPGG